MRPKGIIAAEMKRYEREFARLAPEEKEKTMGLVSSWERQGIEQGIQQGTHEGKETLLVRMMQRRFGSLVPELIGRLDVLSSEQLDELGIAFLDFASIADLETWLARSTPR